MAPAFKNKCLKRSSQLIEVTEANASAGVRGVGTPSCCAPDALGVQSPVLWLLSKFKSHVLIM